MADLLAATRGTRLAAAAPAMVSEVYGVESEATRGLHQPVTPPMTPAAKEAREALASVHDVE